MKKPENKEVATAKTVRGKYLPHLLEKGSNVALIDPDIVDQFPDSASVNEALRAFLVMREQFAALHGLPNTSRVSSGQRRTYPLDPRTGKKHIALQTSPRESVEENSGVGTGR